MTQLILGLGNRARHGKDSFAQAITQYYAALDAHYSKHVPTHKPTVIQRISFADPLYKEVNAWLATSTGQGWRSGAGGALVDSYLDIRTPEWVTPDNPAVDPRAPYGKYAKLLQWWGSDYRRAQDLDYWTKQWKAAINPNALIVMSTDMRFPNEASAVKQVGGYTIQVNRLNADGTPFVDTSRDPSHVSETSLDNYNYDFKITVKTGDLVLLEEWAITLVHFLRARKSK